MGPMEKRNHLRGLKRKKTMVIHLAMHGFSTRTLRKTIVTGSGWGKSAARKNESPLRRSGLILSGANTWK